MGPINSKVTAAALGGGIGGATLAGGIIWICTSFLGIEPAKFTTDGVIFLTAICSIPAGFLSGYMKKHNLAVDD